MEDGLYIGIDTHKEFHAFCALDERGAVALEGTCAASEAAYEGLCRSLEEAGRPARVAIEGSSSYGRGLSDHMRRRGYDVREAVRPGRRAYSPDGKTDAVDALAAARLAFWDQCAGEPKDNGGPSEDLAYLVLPPMYFPPFTPMIHNRSRQPAPAGYANVFPPLSAPPPNLSRNARASRARALSEPG